MGARLLGVPGWVLRGLQLGAAIWGGPGGGGSCPCPRPHPPRVPTDLGAGPRERGPARPRGPPGLQAPLPLLRGRPAQAALGFGVGANPPKPFPPPPPGGLPSPDTPLPTSPGGCFARCPPSRGRCCGAGCGICWPRRGRILMRASTPSPAAASAGRWVPAGGDNTRGGLIRGCLTPSCLCHPPPGGRHRGGQPVPGGVRRGLPAAQRPLLLPRALPRRAAPALRAAGAGAGWG